MIPLVYLLFIVKTSLRSFAFSLIAQRNCLLSNSYRYNKCEAFKVLCRLFSHTLPRPGKDKSIMRVAQYTLALQHYRGGHPVPRAASLYDGGVYIYANKCTHAGYFSLLFALLFFSNNQIAGLSSDRHPFG